MFNLFTNNSIMISHAASTVTKSWRSGTAFVQESGQASMYVFKHTCLEMFLCWMTSGFQLKKAIIKAGISKRKCHSLFQKKCPIPGSGFNKNSLVGSGIVVSLINSWFSYCCSFQWRRGLQEIDFTSESFYKEEKEKYEDFALPSFQA